MNKYDYIITGAGASGLMLAYRIAKDPFFDQKSIALIDVTKKRTNDRTWCFWEKEKGQWDEFLAKSWSDIFFGGTDFEKRFSISPYIYKMIRSEAFYRAIWETLDKTSNFTFIQDSVRSIEDTAEGVRVETATESFLAEKVFNSVILSKEFLHQRKYPVLQQHFVGWFIKTETDQFDDQMATLMDFRVPQKGHTRFMYVLPLQKKLALVEYTLFSENLLEQSAYESEIRAYLAKHQIFGYSIEETEKGSIPMTSFDFGKYNTPNILNMGTAGGWTKASTGYTFMNTTKKTAELVDFLKHNQDLSKFSKRTKFWFYDMIMLDVLAGENHLGARLFSGLFRKTKIQYILKFLDEETTLAEDLKIISSMPTLKFTLALLNRLFRF